MTDSDSALRSKRYRAHKRGDHRLCDPSRCRARRVAESTAVAFGEDGYEPTETATQAVDALVGALAFSEDDPRSVMAVIARRLAVAFDEAPTAAIARELRGTVAWLAERPNEAADQLDELRARRLVRLVDVATQHGVGSE